MPYDVELADRIRDGLSAQRVVREAAMFGGLGFMINNKLAVFAHSDGGLWLRAAPQRQSELEARGAQPADMGAGRAMGPGWLKVGADTVTTQKGLMFWLGVAVDYNRVLTERPNR